MEKMIKILMPLVILMFFACNDEADCIKGVSSINISLLEDKYKAVRRIERRQDYYVIKFNDDKVYFTTFNPKGRFYNNDYNNIKDFLINFENYNIETMCISNDQYRFHLVNGIDVYYYKDSTKIDSINRIKIKNNWYYYKPQN